MPRGTASRQPPAAWTRAELAVLRRLRSPGRIQDFLDGLAYRTEDLPASPRRVLAERRAHCFDGALFAAAALRLAGHKPLLVDLQAVRDDDHVLAVYRDRGRWGALAKSNFSGLRFRDPIFRDLRELAASYFEDYFNLRGEKTLRNFSVPFDLSRREPRGPSLVAVARFACDDKEANTEACDEAKWRSAVSSTSATSPAPAPSSDVNFTRTVAPPRRAPGAPASVGRATAASTSSGTASRKPAQGARTHALSDEGATRMMPPVPVAHTDLKSTWGAAPQPSK